MSQDKIVYPDFKKIIDNCKNIMLEKFPQYKNSWTTMDYDLGQCRGWSENKFWDKRLTTEVEEFFKAKTIAEARKELEDIINVCAMIHEQLTFTKDPNWRYSM